MENQPNQPQKGGKNALWIVLAIVILAVIGYGVYAYVSSNADNTNTANTNGNSNQAVNIDTASNTNSAANTNSNVNAVANANTNSATNTNIDTSGWKTYENNSYGFSIKYPSAWSQTQSSIDREDFQYEAFNFIPQSDANANYQIRVYDSYKELAGGNGYNSFLSWIKAQETGPYKYPLTNYIVDGTYEGYWPSSDTTYAFFMEHGGKIYSINMTWISPETRNQDDNTQRPIFNEEESAFLLSFKFI